MIQDILNLPQELINIIIQFHHCYGCYKYTDNCLECYLKCNCVICKLNIEYNKQYCLLCMCDKINSNKEKCNCDRCSYLPHLYYYKIRKQTLNSICNNCKKTI